MFAKGFGFRAIQDKNKSMNTFATELGSAGKHFFC